MITELIRESVDAFHRMRLDTCARTPAGQIQEHGSVTVLYSGTEFASLNLVVATTPDPDPADVSRAAAALTALGRPWMMEFADQPSAEVRQAAAEWGLTEHRRLPLMACPTPELILQDKVSDGLTIETVGSERWEEYSAVMAEGFGMPEGSLGTLLGGDVLDAPGTVSFLARFQGEPAGTSAGMVENHLLGVFNVSVLPAARGQGIGRALTEAALLHVSAEGTRAAFLRSSPMAKPLYESMGFREVAWSHALTAPTT